MKIIIVTGASGGGKTTLCELLPRHVHGLRVAVVSVDWCYRDPAPGEDPTARNYDHPAAFDYDTLCEGIAALRAGQPYDFPVYDYTVHRRDPTKRNRVEPCDVIIIEGILLLYTEKVRKLADLSVYVHADLDICLARRLLRDTKTRGRTMESVLEQYFKHVRPSFLEFIYPTMGHADVIIRNVTQIDDVVQSHEFAGVVDWIGGRGGKPVHTDKKIDLAILMSSLHIHESSTAPSAPAESGSGST